MIWNQAESASREEIEATQLRRLRETARRVYAVNPFYKEKFEEAGITPEDIRTLDDKFSVRLILGILSKFLCDTATFLGQLISKQNKNNNNNEKQRNCIWLCKLTKLLPLDNNMPMNMRTINNLVLK